MRAIFFCALPLLAGCSLADWEACTMEFRIESVRVTTSAGVPVTDAVLDVRRMANGRSILCMSDPQAGCLREEAWNWGERDGHYVVMHDGVAVARGGEDFRVTATRGASKAEAVLRFAHDGCHVQKRSGPEEIRLSP